MSLARKLGEGGNTTEVCTERSVHYKCTSLEKGGYTLVQYDQVYCTKLFSQPEGCVGTFKSCPKLPYSKYPAPHKKQFTRSAPLMKSLTLWSIT